MNAWDASCPFCESNAKARTRRGDCSEFECPRCGKFEITWEAGVDSRMTPEMRRQVSGWVRDRNREGVVPRITTDALRGMVSLPLPSTAERAERLLLEALHDQKRLDASINLDDPRFIAATYSWDQREMLALYGLLKERGWMASQTLGPTAEITIEGYMAADKLTAKRGRSEEVFVAMSFSPEMTTAYERGLRVGIEHAGYVPIRVDRTEHVNRIDDEIVARIRSSAFVVADFTEQKSGVYFEAGFALGLNLPVIWTCRDYDISKLHFDVRQYNCIDWTDEADLARRLRLRIEAIVGRGPRAAYASDVRAQSAEEAST